MNGTTVAAFKKELADYDTSKGTIRFTRDTPLPAALVRKLVESASRRERGEEQRQGEEVTVTIRVIEESACPTDVQFLKTSAAGAAGLAWVDPLHAFTAAPDPAAAPLTLRFRQVHLDFHTSPLIPDVAKDFDPERYADTLARAHVDSVTTFARCHHGLIYYDTKAFPERRHPNLRRNLLPEQVAACHRRNIRVPIYVTVQWDQFTADAHPEWRIVTETGALVLVWRQKRLLAGRRPSSGLSKGHPNYGDGPPSNDDQAVESS